MTRALLFAALLAVPAAAQIAGLDQLAGRSAQRAVHELRALVSQPQNCSDDPDAHGPPYCAMAFSNDWKTHHFVTISMRRGGGHSADGDMAIGRADGADSIRISIDRDGNVISAERWLADGTKGKLSVDQTRAEIESALAKAKGK